MAGMIGTMRRHGRDAGKGRGAGAAVGPWARAAFLTALAFLPAPAAMAGDPASEVRVLYDQLAAAQNRRDAAAVRGLLLDSPDFLWVSDGKPFWGPETMVERMASFQRAEVWHVTPDLAAARAVPLSPGSAYLHLPLELAIGGAAEPDRLRFLVSLLGVETPAGWRVAALLTTEDKRTPAP